MFVETRTTATEVIEDILKEVRSMAFRVINDADTRLTHPTYLTKPMQRENLHRLMGAYEVAYRVVGTDLPSELDALVTRANDVAKASLAKK